MTLTYPAPWASIVRMRQITYFLPLFLFFGAGCSTLRGQHSGPVGEIIRNDGKENIASVDPKSISPVPAASSSLHQQYFAPSEVWGVALKNRKFDFPITINHSVEHWISYFHGKGRRYFEKYLERGHYFVPEISKVLHAHHMPQDLVYLAMVESGFNNSARSRARAVGPWQFMRQTGKLYGLNINYWIDERRDTRKATSAAIKYLSKLYQEFGSWELAAAAYNAGEGKIHRAIAKYRTNDFWEIARHRFFKRETRDYVPKIIAAAIMAKNATLFGFNPNRYSNELIADSELTPKELGEELTKEDDTSEDTAEQRQDIADDEEENTDEDPAVVLQTPGRVITPSMYMVSNPKEQIVEFAIRGPADLFAISKAAGLPYSTIKMLNPELSRWCTPPSFKTYRIKLPLSSKDRFLSAYNDENFDRRVQFMRYTIRRGDNLKKIARRFGTDTDPIRELNNLGSSVMVLAVGSVVSLPVPTGYKRVIAGMYDEKPMPERKRGRRHRRRRHTAVNMRLKPNISRRVVAEEG